VQIDRVLSNYTANFKAGKMYEIWMFINWSKNRSHKFSSKYFPTFAHKSSHFSQSLFLKPKIFKNSTQDMCRSIWCKYEQHWGEKAWDPLKFGLFGMEWAIIHR